ncbi:MAG: thermonuclease family protein [Desulfobulbia bacterium]
MRENKITFAIVLSFVISINIPTQTFAHGGGLDAQGGHTNRKTGEYHFHRGPQAGQPASAKQKTSGSVKRTGQSPAGKQLVGVASVIDGDTIEIHGQRIRLHGIDAPESSQVCMVENKPWRCGAEAANKLAEKIGKNQVSCEGRDKDRHGRVVAVCTVGEQNINSWMAQEGQAVAYRKYSADYVGQEEEAKAGKRGIWASKFDMPWDWRKGKK